MKHAHEVYLEFTTLGGSVKVTAIDPETGLEAVAIGPANALQRDLENLALAKLRRITKKLPN